MCGIFGLVVNPDSGMCYNNTKELIKKLFRLSESRGKDAAGIAVRNSEGIYIYKRPVSASRLIRSDEYSEFLEKYLKRSYIKEEPLVAIGHSRMTTNGAHTLNRNNQPVIKDGIAGVHNGIITNSDDIFSKNNITKECDVDTEALFGLIKKNLVEYSSLSKSVNKTFEEIEGAASIATFFDDLPAILLSTNTGSLFCFGDDKIFIFASERYFLEMVIKSGIIKRDLDKKDIWQLRPGESSVIDIENRRYEKFDSSSEGLKRPIKKLKIRLSIKDVSPEVSVPEEKPYHADRSLLEYDPDPDVKRCTRCVIPETFPGIKFDDDGVCNLCREHEKTTELGKEKLIEKLKKYRRDDGRPDCIIGLSGGRDSSYGLHYIKKVLGMNPITFTYDWGMITDLARRNIARMTGRLGVENILISADIHKKRENIRKNVTAWLKRPELGMIPLFMAGDKQFYYHANKLMKETGIRLMIFCENEKFEKTKFKSGFCGIDEGKKRLFQIPATQKIKLATYCMKEIAKNPKYINRSLIDTMSAYFSAYMIEHDYLYLFKYIEWDEDVISRTLIDEYGWELAKDTKSTWRIGDGTAPFYNYIYYTVAGFSENDTFRSNQIREGVISRDEALKMIKEDNKPRFESIMWYCKTVGIDFDETIKTINSIPKLYKK